MSEIKDAAKKVNDAIDHYLEVRKKINPDGYCFFKGQALAARINGAIGNGDDRSSKILIAASAAGIDVSTMNQILNGTINCPPMRRLEGIARSVGVSIASLVSSARRDGCTRYDNNEN